MDNYKKYEKVCEQFGSLQHLNPPMHIDWMPSLAWYLLFDREDITDTCVVYLHVENGIGIADRNKKGYTPTPCYIYPETNGQEAVNWFNEHILGLSPTEYNKIILSTF